MAESIQNGVFRRNNTVPPADNGVMALFSLAGKTAIISGAGGGIGLAAAKAFAEAGANVAIWYNSNSETIEKAASIEKAFNVKCNDAKFYAHTLPLDINSTCSLTDPELNRQSI